MPFVNTHKMAMAVAESADMVRINEAVAELPQYHESERLTWEVHRVYPGTDPKDDFGPLLLCKRTTEHGWREIWRYVPDTRIIPDWDQVFRAMAFSMMRDLFA